MVEKGIVTGGSISKKGSYDSGSLIATPSQDKLKPDETPSLCSDNSDADVNEADLMKETNDVGILMTETVQKEKYLRDQQKTLSFDYFPLNMNVLNRNQIWFLMTKN